MINKVENTHVLKVISIKTDKQYTNTIKYNIYFIAGLIDKFIKVITVCKGK